MPILPCSSQVNGLNSLGPVTLAQRVKFIQKKIELKAHITVSALYILPPDQSPLDNVEGVWASNKPFEKFGFYRARVRYRIAAPLPSIFS